jgi:hypothetical protein
VDVIQEKDLLAQIDEHFNPIEMSSEELALADNMSGAGL